MLTLCLCLILFQEKPPEYSDISDLKGLTKVYVTADSTEAREGILKALKKHPDLLVVPAQDCAEFIIETREISPEGARLMGVIRNPPTVEMTVYTIVKERKKIAWSKTKKSYNSGPVDLTKNFIKALKKLSH